LNIEIREEEAEALFSAIDVTQRHRIECDEFIKFLCEPAKGLQPYAASAIQQVAFQFKDY